MNMRLPHIIRDDLPRKSVALFFAVLIWFAVRNQLHDFATFHDVPVTLQYEPDKIVVERRILTASVSLRGARRRLETLQASDITVTADIPVVPAGVYSYDLRFSPANVREPPGTSVTSITPTSARIQVDRIIQKELPVRVRESGQLGYGYRVVERTILPSRVTATGPSRVLEDVTEVTTEPIVLDETLIQSFKMDQLDLIPMPRVNFRPDTVHVAYEITRHSGQKALMELPIRVLTDETSDLQLVGELPSASVTLRGPRITLDTLRPHSVRPFVDVTAVTNPGRYTFPLKVWVEAPSTLVVEYVHPPEVDVVLRRSDAPAPQPEEPPGGQDAMPETDDRGLGDAGD